MGLSRVTVNVYVTVESCGLWGITSPVTLIVVESSCCKKPSVVWTRPPSPSSEEPLHVKNIIKMHMFIVNK